MSHPPHNVKLIMEYAAQAKQSLRNLIKEKKILAE